jgi:hypothetical protein
MSTRFWSLALKELRLIRRDTRLALSLISRPTYPAPLCDQLADHRYRLDGHLHGGVGGRLVGGFIFGDCFLALG